MTANDEAIPIRLLNLSAEEVTLYGRSCIATGSPVCKTQIAESIHHSINAVGQSSKPSERDDLWQAVTQSGDSLKDEQKELLFLLLSQYPDVFASHSEDYGRTGRIKHQIHTGDAAPIRQPFRRIPPAKKEEVTKLLQGMLSKGIIQPSSSPWASPVVLVRKKDGSTRFCIDYQKVNPVTRKDAYPLPRVDDTLDTLAGTKWFTTLDLLSGYWQVEVGIQWSSCLVYLDDIIVVGKTFEEHLRNLAHKSLTNFVVLASD